MFIWSVLHFFCLQCDFHVHYAFIFLFYSFSFVFYFTFLLSHEWTYLCVFSIFLHTPWELQGHNFQPLLLHNYSNVISVYSLFAFCFSIRFYFFFISSVSIQSTLLLLSGYYLCLRVLFFLVCYLLKDVVSESSRKWPISLLILDFHHYLWTHVKQHFALWIYDHYRLAEICSVHQGNSTVYLALLLGCFS